MKLKYILSIFSIIVVFTQILSAQYKIYGTVTDENIKPLIGASIYISDRNIGALTDDSGNYMISNLHNGNYKIQYSYLGFKNKFIEIEIKNEDIHLNIQLVETAIEAEEIVITGGYNSTQHENAVKVDVLKLNPLTDKNTPNFMEMLTKISGVDMISKGSGISKPVIRGLSMNDILVLNNGVRNENYQYSSHHPLGIDEFGIGSVEVIKGPASLFYGSDAIGGIINFIKEKPAPVGQIIGDYNLQLYSNSLGMTNNFGIKGTSERLNWGIRAGHKTNSDYLQGGGEFVPNSRFNEYSIKANIGTNNKFGLFNFYYDYNHEKLGLVEEEAIENILIRSRQNEIFYQRFNTHLLSFQNILNLNKYKLDINAAFQSTELVHFGEKDIFELQMMLNTLTYDLKLHLPSNTNSEYIIAFQGFNQQNINTHDRETILLPDAITQNYSVFGLLQHTFFDKLKLQTGLRFDKRFIDTKQVGISSDPERFRPPLNKKYNSFSGSIGATYNISDIFLVRANFASAYRTPNLPELTSNGPHEAIFEKGDAELVPENAYEGDISFHYHVDNITCDLAVYYNSIANYIFIAPTDEYSIDGLHIYKYTQNDAKLYGGEFGLHIHPKYIKWLHFETKYSRVIGKNSNGDYLPFIPADKVDVELRLEKAFSKLFKKSFISINNHIAFDQKKPAPNEDFTSGYSLYDLSIGSEMIINKQSLIFSFSINNIFDKKYIDHLSTLNEVGYFDQDETSLLA